MPIANSHLVVMGGTSGLGLEIVKAAHASGIKVTIGGRGAERAAETAKSIGPDVTAVHIDLGDLASIRPALRDGPPIDHLVITPIMRLSTTVKDFAIAKAEQLARIKLVGYVEAVSAALPQGPNPVVDAMTAKTPTRRLAMTEDVIQGVFFLLDNKAVNGIDLELDGGIQIV